MNQAKPPPIDLEKYLAGKKHRYCTYQNGARLYSMAYWSFVVMCKEAGANISLRKTALVDLDVLDKYIEENCNEAIDNQAINLLLVVAEFARKYSGRVDWRVSRIGFSAVVRFQFGWKLIDMLFKLRIGRQLLEY